MVAPLLPDYAKIATPKSWAASLLWREKMDQEISSQIKTIEVMVVDYSLDLVGAIAILVIGWIVADWIKLAKERVEATGCTIPFPQRDIHVIGGRAPATA